MNLRKQAESIVDAWVEMGGNGTSKEDVTRLVEMVLRDADAERAKLRGLLAGLRADGSCADHMRDNRGEAFRCMLGGGHAGPHADLRRDEHGLHVIRRQWPRSTPPIGNAEEPKP